MLIKSTTFMSRAVKKVNKTALKAIIPTTIAILGSTGTATSVYANEVVQETVTVKFSVAKLAAQDGAVAVYDLLARKAGIACFKTSVDLAGHVMSRKDCVDDLMDQFIASAATPALTELHLVSGDMSTSAVTIE